MSINILYSIFDVNNSIYLTNAPILLMNKIAGNPSLTEDFIVRVRKDACIPFQAIMIIPGYGLLVPLCARTGSSGYNGNGYKIP